MFRKYVSSALVIKAFYIALAYALGLLSVQGVKPLVSFTAHLMGSGQVQEIQLCHSPRKSNSCGDFE
jgi:hypothetical protein